MSAIKNSQVKSGVVTINVKLTPEMGLDDVDCAFIINHLFKYSELLVLEVQNYKYAITEGIENKTILLN